MIELEGDEELVVAAGARRLPEGLVGRGISIQDSLASQPENRSAAYA
jgi:hypothetical protein